MKKTMILTSMALMSLVAGCANEEVKDTQDNQPVVQQIWKKYKQKAM